MSKAVPVVSSAKQQLVLTAERLFAQHGLAGVPLRQIGAEAGMANKSVVQYHFGSKEGLIEAILVNRLEQLLRRRQLLEARTPAEDLRAVVEAHQLPLIELAEDQSCYYLPFLEQLLRHHGDASNPLERLPTAHNDSQQAYIDRVGSLIDHVPQPLRDQRIHQVSAICVHTCADRHRALVHGSAVSSYALHVSAFLDGVVALLTAPASEQTLAALQGTTPERPALQSLP
ncbi:TetR/AcrR family transcriptional regulator [Mycobacterium sp. RTGN5]|uniref:TetR/AcrR family transcriptional regulator n=1 Tax=Mycobacterium sp. RTGN5 TaxID=3016522 RepID=UPI0029C78083|nr:TetR/AcrR family transcriptional regulator [Mycobacterium sp. RTGN5]